MKTIAIALTGMALFAAAPAVAQTNLLANGSFESGATSWTSAGSTSFTTAVAAGVSVSPFPTSAGSPDAAGTKVAQLLSSSGVTPSTISQSISVVAGTIYSIGYDLVLFNAAAAGTFSTTVKLGAVTLAGLTVASGSLTSGTWVEKIVTFKALSTGTQALTVTYTPTATASKSVAVDRVYVQNIPEPASALLLLAGAAGLYRVRRRTS